MKQKMATFNSNVKIPKATEHFSTFNLSCDHITTQDFFKIKPVYTRVMVPGQSINVDMSHISRLAPLAKPFYGSVTMTNRAFFVPFRTIMEGFNEFITDTPYTQSSGSAVIINSVPTVKMSTICNVLSGNNFSVNSTTGQPDFLLKPQSSGNTVPKKYTPLGRYAVDVLNCLGYQVDWSSLYDTSGVGNITMSALPLLAYIRIYTDYLENTNFAPLSSLQSLFRGANKEIVESDLTFLFANALYASYENDYLTASWSNPNAPYSSVSSRYAISDATLPNTSIDKKSSVDTNNSDRTPRIVSDDGISHTPNSLTTYILTALQSLSDYMKRHQISGYRAIDRFRSRFGITLPDAKLNRSVYLGKNETPIDITDVTSTADTTSAVLGQYSGFGISRNGNSGTFSYKTDEYGIFVILSIISPIHAQYANGLDRHLLDLGRLDLYTPEFDGLGCQAIANCEVKSDFSSANQQETPLAVWAYTPRYAHYKCSRDILSGDFKVPSKNQSMRNFHLFRDFSDVPIHNLDFCTGNTADYTRVFNDTTSASDHFFTAFHFNVRSDAPMSSLFENYHFDESGAPIEQKVGGTRLS